MNCLIIITINKIHIAPNTTNNSSCRFPSIGLLMTYSKKYCDKTNNKIAVNAMMDSCLMVVMIEVCRLNSGQ